MIHFDSWEHLLHLLRITDLRAVSRAVLGQHAAQERGVFAAWKEAVRKVTAGFEPGGRGNARHLKFQKNSAPIAAG